MDWSKFFRIYYANSVNLIIVGKVNKRDNSFFLSQLWNSTIWKVIRWVNEEIRKIKFNVKSLNWHLCTWLWYLFLNYICRWFLKSHPLSLRILSKRVIVISFEGTILNNKLCIISRHVGENL